MPEADLTAEQKALAQRRARLPRSLRQLRGFVDRLAGLAEHSAYDAYLLDCLRAVLLEQEVASATSGRSVHPGLRVEGNAWPGADPATRFSVALTGGRGRLLRRGFPTTHAARCAAVRLADAADWRLPTAEFGAQHHAAVLAEETRPI
ncbi:hypothetical protein GCM10010441_29360 [Kitasatospora paracochleata]|uniref:Uncharacterized protein n=1 Tax=Kitasatospora paracochleata TaxID=58354 RepID=A0ABT1J8Y0_9ACTN|nr:hypothetical protein [Kitasatospora paracochleata]MCP2313897.1 hypothetical protein [Kitasatospora paracochleata]